MKKKTVSGILLALIGGILWGCSGACGQFLFENYNVTANWLVPLRLFTGGLILTVVYLIKDAKASLAVWKEPRNLPPLLIYSIGGIMLCQYSYFALIQISNAGTATVLQYLAPVMIMAIVCITGHKLPRLSELISLLLAMGGVFLISTHGNMTTLSVSWKVIALGIFCAATVVVYNLSPRSLLKQYPAPMLLGWAMLIGGSILMLIFAPWQMHVRLDAAGWLAVAVIIFLGSIVAFSLYMMSINIIGAERTSIYSSVEPLTAELLSVVWLHSPLYPADAAAFVMIISTVFLLTFGGKKKKYLPDKLHIFGSGVGEADISVDKIVKLAKKRGYGYSGEYTLVTGGMAKHESSLAGVRLTCLLERCGMAASLPDSTPVKAFFKDGYSVSYTLGEIRRAEKPVIVAFECGGLPLIGPTGREPVYKRFGEEDGYFRAAGNSGGPLRLVAEGCGGGASNAPGCGKWLAAIAVGEAGDYAYSREVDSESAGELPESVKACAPGEKVLTVSCCGRKTAFSLSEIMSMPRVRAFYAARDGRYAFEGITLRSVIERCLAAGEVFPEHITVTSSSGYERDLDADMVLDGIDSTYQPGEHRDVILAFACGGKLLVPDSSSPGYTRANDGAPLRLIAENSIALWIKGVYRITATCASEKTPHSPQTCKTSDNSDDKRAAEDCLSKC